MFSSKSKKISNTQKKKQKRAEREQRRLETLEYISYHHNEMEKQEREENFERDGHEIETEDEADNKESDLRRRESDEEILETHSKQTIEEKEEFEQTAQENEENCEKQSEEDDEKQTNQCDEKDDEENVELENQAAEEDLEEEVDESGTGNGIDDLQVMNSLTGSPHEDDTILYAVPVCAPYSTLADYKFRVKLLPGQSKKGKSWFSSFARNLSFCFLLIFYFEIDCFSAIKSVLLYFQQEKGVTAHEKDLIRVLKDQDVSRNLPGKVKLSLPSNLRSNLNKK